MASSGRTAIATRAPSATKSPSTAQGPAPSKSTPKPKKTKFHELTAAYASRWGKNDDQTTVTEEQRRSRQKAAVEVSDTYYDIVTHAYIRGWSTSFHHTPFPSAKHTIQSSLQFYEHRLAHLMSLQRHMLVLDVGCGVGGPAREIARFIGCGVVGISINQTQIDIATELTRDAGLGHLCTFIRGDFLKLDEYFKPDSFDAAYAIEATVHAPALGEVYTSIQHVLKPGGVFGLSEWVLTPKFEYTNPKHVGIRNRIERGNGLTNLVTSDECRAAFVGAGFEVLHEEDYAAHFEYLAHEPVADLSPGNGAVEIPFAATYRRAGSADLAKDTATTSTTSNSNPHAPSPPFPLKTTLPSKRHRQWYFPLSPNTSLKSTYTLSPTLSDFWTTLKMSPLPRKINWSIISILERLGLYPKGAREAMDTLAYCVDGVAEGGREGVFSPCWWVVGRKGGSEDEGEDEDGDGDGAGEGGERYSGEDRGGNWRGEDVVGDDEGGKRWP